MPLWIRLGAVVLGAICLSACGGGGSADGVSSADSVFQIMNQ